MQRSVVRLFALLSLVTGCSISEHAPAPAAPPSAVEVEVAVDVEHPSVALCNGSGARCFARARIDVAPVRAPLATPAGYGPPDLIAAYNLGTATAVTATVAVVEAFGYPGIEGDLEMYRSQYGLPPCTIASGCLTVVNQEGQTAPLPGAAPTGDDWPAETALDIDMISAGCPSCKILVVEADDDVHDGLMAANDTAATLGATEISNSWGQAEAASSELLAAEAHFNHPGIAIFASTGDDGYERTTPTVAAAQYPASSAYAIAVGGTTLEAASNPRGWTETAWHGGGSSCSASVVKPSWQTSNACEFRMISDLSAIGDPATGVAVYNAADGGWMISGGTSVASPLVAAIFAQTGHPSATPELAYQTVGGFYDVTSGSNGSCSPDDILCTAGTGWDGPTGNGTPNAAVLSGAAKPPTLTVTAPFDGQFLPPGYKVEVACTPTDSSTIKEVDIAIDGEQFGTFTAPPFTITAPVTLANNGHVISITCTTTSIVQATATLDVTQSAACSHDSDCTIDGEVCYGGACIAGPAVANGIGATCTAAGDCSSQDCALDGSAAVCAVACEPSGAACPGGFSCSAPDDGSGGAQCLPAHGGGCDAAGGGPPIALFAVGLIMMVVRTRPRWRA